MMPVQIASANSYKDALIRKRDLCTAACAAVAAYLNADADFQIQSIEQAPQGPFYPGPSAYEVEDVIKLTDQIDKIKVNIEDLLNVIDNAPTEAMAGMMRVAILPPLQQQLEQLESQRKYIEDCIEKSAVQSRDTNPKTQEDAQGGEK